MSGKRPDGDGLVRKRADGRWEGRIVIGHKDDGLPIYKSVFAKTQKELMPKLHQAIEDYQGVDLSENSKITLGEWMDKWLAEYAEPALRPSTVYGYRSDIKNHIKPALGNKQLRFITQKDVQQFYNSLKRKKVNKVGNHKTLADSTIRGIHMLLHEILDSAVKANLIFKNPTDGAKIPKNNYAPKRILNEEQLEIFMKEMLGENTKLRFRPSYFPFTEPSYEVDVSCFKCGGKGCNLCKQTGWIELLGAGIVHPNVLKMNGYDPDKYSGFAFGTGLDRLAMFKYGITDIRLLYENDVRFLKQFDRMDNE